MERRLTAILAADVVGYSRLMGVNETGTLSALKALQADFIDRKIAQHQGRIVKLTGDGMLVEFPSVVNAVACAAEVQRGMRDRNDRVPQDRRIEFRIGVNLGDVIIEGEDIFGDGVNVAARLEEIAPVGGIAVSQSVRDHVGKRLHLIFEDIGERRLKNIERPIRVYSVSLDAPTEQTSGAASAHPQEKPSIAVLPFINMSGDPEQEYFSDGITEDIITDLSKVSGLFVVARNTAFTYKGKSVEVQEVAKRLGVNFILEGSVRKAGSRVRVTGQLIDGKTGGHMWADRYDRDLTDIFAIQDEITHAIVEQLKVKLLPQEKKNIAQTPTDNVEAYTYYLRGRQFIERRSKAYYQLARQMFAKAVELDPLYARAYAGMADCDSFLFLHYHVDNVAIDDILATSAKALALDSDLAEAHASRGLALSLEKRYDEATEEFEQAIALDPHSFEGHYFYGRACFTQGKLERAAALFERVAEIKPDDYQALCLLIQIYRSLDRDADARSAARRGVERVERDLTLHPDNPRSAYLGAAALVALGENDRAREWLSRALAIDPHDIWTQYNAACIYTNLGDIERALDVLESVLPHAGYELKHGWIKHDSDLDPLRNHPRFQKILESIE
jgi:Predicted integral membrane protein